MICPPGVNERHKCRFVLRTQPRLTIHCSWEDSIENRVEFSMGFGGKCAQRDLIMFHVSQAACWLGMHADMLPQSAAERTDIRFDQRPSNDLGKAHATSSSLPPRNRRQVTWTPPVATALQDDIQYLFALQHIYYPRSIDVSWRFVSLAFLALSTTLNNHSGTIKTRMNSIVLKLNQ
ncbi:hypothetical protein AB1N83_004233 [Pleurotus pulmonarius]